MHNHRTNFNELGHAHELTFSCYNNYKFLQAERTCEWLAECIESARQKYKFLLWCYVFMPDHVHLILLPHPNDLEISSIRKSIKAPVGIQAMAFLEANHPEWLPKVTRRRGDKVERLFWQSGGGYDRNVESSTALYSMIDYIHMNPVRAGLVERASEWKWSSAKWYENQTQTPLAIDPIPPDWLD